MVESLMDHLHRVCRLKPGTPGSCGVIIILFKSPVYMGNRRDRDDNDRNVAGFISGYRGFYRTPGSSPRSRSMLR